MMRRLFTLALTITCMSGCSSMLTPDYLRPAAPIPQSWPTGATQESETKVADKRSVDIGWRNFIIDAHLQALVEMALNNNRSLRITALNIDKARAVYGISRANQLPQINAIGNGTHGQSATDLPGSGAATRLNHSYAAGVGVSSYELDLFGKLHNQSDSARENWLASIETFKAARISLVAEVVGNYLTLAANRELLQLADYMLQNQQQTLQLTQYQFEAGLASQLDVSAAQASLDGVRAEVASATSAVTLAENSLSLLIGTPLPSELQPLPDLLTSSPVLQDVPAGLSSDVLLRRPDLLADEHALKAANANIGAARAAFFPSITLTATAGSASNDISRLFAGGNGTWSFVPQISIPLFNGGALVSALDQAKTVREIQLAIYEKNIQTAFQEVANALAQRGTLGTQLRAHQSLTKAREHSYQLATVRYQNGIDSLLSLLANQRALYVAQQSLLTTRLAQQGNLVTLFKALGGGVHE